MEDSGIDSDPKPNHMSESDGTPTKDGYVKNDINSYSVMTKQPKTSVQLQKKIEKRIEQAHRLYPTSSSIAEQQLRKGLIPINRLHVPSKNLPPIKDSAEQPLVSWKTDSEDEYEFQPPPSRRAAREITKQLQKDGFNLDLSPDDEDLDLIPPQPINQRYFCCQSKFTCIIQ